MQEIQENSPSQSQKYPQFIQDLSHHLMTNPNDNYNGFSTNKLNIIPISVERNDNIKINNSSDGEKQYYSNIINSQNIKNMNEINYNKSSLNNYNGETGLNNSKKKKSKVKILKY